MKKFFIVAFLILFAAQICQAATQTLDRTTADSRVRQSFELTSVEGDSYSVRIIGENEKLLHDWHWAKGDDIWTGDYFAYIARRESQNFELQNVEVFAQNYKNEYTQRINLTQPCRDGVYLVTGLNNMPDLLVSKIQFTSGAFDTKIFAIKNGRLQQLKFLKDDKTFQNGRDSSVKPVTYLNDGTISVPWYSNVAPVAGSYVTIYMLDVDNLILIPAYTNKL